MIRQPHGVTVYKVNIKVGMRVNNLEPKAVISIPFYYFNRFSDYFTLNTFYPLCMAAVLPLTVTSLVVFCLL